MRRAGLGVVTVLAIAAGAIPVVAHAGLYRERMAARRFPDAVRITHIGRGVRGDTILRPAGVRGPLPGVVFVHGWLAVDVRYYRAWLTHLVREGNVVVHPTYQDARTSPGRFLANLMAGLRMALPRAGIRPGTLIAVGHSAGATLAADYADRACSAGLTPPAAVFAVYPGRRLLRFPRVPIPWVGETGMPLGTRLVALAGADDHTVGERTARLLASASGRRGRLVVVRDPGADEHLAPQTDDAAVRKTLWHPLDVLMASARASAPPHCAGRS